jgi:regulator of cell morphogenesis and NO signaling
VTIHPETRVADIAAALPFSIPVFQRTGIDFCCGGDKPLAVACEEQGLVYDEVAAAITAAGAERPGGERDWARETLASLADHIEERYHEPLFDELPRLQQMAARVRQAHAAKAPALVERLEAVLSELASDLEAHMQKEEAVLFPAIRALEAAALRGEAAAPPLAAPIHVMEREHDRAGALLAELRTVTADYVAPEWACRTFRGLYHGLETLERDMHVHVHLENNVLFPRALGLAGAR